MLKKQNLTHPKAAKLATLIIHLNSADNSSIDCQLSIDSYTKIPRFPDSQIPRFPDFLSGCSRFSRVWEVNFFLEEVQFILEGYILKLALSHDKALPCIFQGALNCSLK